MITDGHMQYLFDEKGKRCERGSFFLSPLDNRLFSFLFSSTSLLMNLPFFPFFLFSFFLFFLFSLPLFRYLDAFAGIVTVSVGHCHPRVLRAIQDQQVK